MLLCCNIINRLWSAVTRAETRPSISIALKPTFQHKATHYFSTQGFIDAICSALFPLAPEPLPLALPPESAELRCGCKNILASGLAAGGAPSVVAMVLIRWRARELEG